MKVASLVMQKGGASKSTLATNLAVVAAQAKKRVLLIDLDPQGTAESWYQDRDNNNLTLIHATANQLPEALHRAKSAGKDFVFIDTPGRDEPATAAAIRESDFCLVPCRPTYADLKALPPTVKTIQRLDRPFAFVLTQTPPKGTRIHEALTGLGRLHSAVSPPIVYRVAYQDALAAGLGVTEFDPTSKAANEVRKLWKWLNRQMEKHADD